MSSITKIKAREILDSRGDPTLEVDTTVDNNFFGRFSVPSGASEGKGVKKLAERLEQEIAPNILNKDFNQNSIDHFLIETDATTNKSNLGANLILGVSMSFAKAESSKLNIPFYKYIASLVGNTSLTLPIPMVNIINGGMHADSGLDIQEFMIVPLLAKSFTESLENCTKVFWHLKSILKENNLSIAVGDEGGFAPKLGSHNKALDFMMQAIEKAGFKAGFDFGVALACAASEFYNPSADGL